MTQSSILSIPLREGASAYSEAPESTPKPNQFSSISSLRLPVFHFSALDIRETAVALSLKWQFSFLSKHLTESVSAFHKARTLSPSIQLFLPCVDLQISIPLLLETAILESWFIAQVRTLISQLSSAIALHVECNQLTSVGGEP